MATGTRSLLVKADQNPAIWVMRQHGTRIAGARGVRMGVKDGSSLTMRYLLQ